MQFSGKQQDPLLQKELCSTYSTIRVVIDDASHRKNDIISTFSGLFPCMSDDSYYVVEDASNFYHGCDNSVEVERMEFFKNMIDSVNDPVLRYRCPGKNMSYFDSNTFSIHFYSEIVLIHKKKNVLNMINKPLKVVSAS